MVSSNNYVMEKKLKRKNIAKKMLFVSKSNLYNYRTNWNYSTKSVFFQQLYNLKQCSTVTVFVTIGDKCVLSWSLSEAVYLHIWGKIQAIWKLSAFTKKFLLHDKSFCPCKDNLRHCNQLKFWIYVIVNKISTYST